MPTDTTTAAAPAVQHLDVPGGSVYYEVRGAGPLLLVVGQPMTSGAFAPLADLLADRHTVVTYDPRGLGLSRLDDPSIPVTPELEADDLARVIDAVGAGPADFFGSSGGAVAGLALAAQQPDRVRTVIAHEPPVGELLPDAAHIRAVVDDVENAFVAGGSAAAWGKFVSLVMHSGPVTADGVAPATWPPPGADAGPADPEPAESEQAHSAPSPKQLADDELFFRRMLRPFTRYRPAIDALRSGTPRIVVAIGQDSGEEIAKRSSVALADQLGIEPTVFPGRHGGFMDDPAGFAEAIEQVL